MTIRPRQTLTLVCGALVLLCLGLSGLARADDDSDLAFQTHEGAYLPLSTPLTNSKGVEAPLKSYFGHVPVLLVLDYLRCRSLCSVTMRNLIGALNRLPLQAGRDYQLVAISVDPRDTAADAAKALAQNVALYARPGATTGFHVLVGRAADTHRIAKAVGFPYRYDSLFDAYVHPAGLVAVAPDGLISHYLEGVSTAPSDIVAALGAAQQERTVGLVGRILVLCHLGGLPKDRLVIPILGAFTLANVIGGCAIAALFFRIRRRRFG